MELVSELVADSKLDTIFKKGLTIHYVRAPDTTPLLGKNKKKHKWEQTEQLGRGSFGTVWLQKLVGGGDKDTDKRAVKQIEKRPAVDYSHELDAIAKFSQDKFNYSFVKSLGWYEDDKHVYISMEYLPHGDLSRHFDESGPLPEHEAQCVAHQILDGLKSMHENGFVHRDLKPQNVLIKEHSPNWWVKLGDFGVSKRMQDAASLSTYTGTDGFMAPEIIMRRGHVNWEALAGRKTYTDAVDIWALGALVFQALTGSEPFAKDLGSYVEGKTPFPYHVLQAQSISRKGCDLLERLLQVIPEKRPTASEALQDPWLKAQEATQRDSIESLRPASTLHEQGKNATNFFRNMAQQTASTVASAASLAWSDAERSTIVFKALDSVRTAAKERFPASSRRGADAVDLESHGNALGLTTLVEQPSPSANDSSIFDLATDNTVQKQPSQSQESLDGSTLNQANSSTPPARVENVKSLRSSEEERRSGSATPPYATRSVTLRSDLDSTDSLQETEEYFDRPITVDDFTLSPGTTLSEASPSQSTSDTSPRAPSGHWTRAMPFSQLSLDSASASPMSPAWSKDPSIIRQKACTLRPLGLPNDLTHTMEPDAFVVIVPGIGDPAVEIWSIDGFRDEPLVRDLTKHYMNIQVLVLEHGLPVNGKDFNRWTQVRDSSHAMMQLIYEYREENNAMSIPMVFLGHGIGGIFIKDFFWKSSSPELRGFPSQWHQNIVNNTVGVIFLGTPHLTSENIADHENIIGLVTRPPTSRRTKSIDRKLLDLDLQNVYLRLLSEEFDTYIRAHRPDLPVLSIWDGRESKAMRVEEHKLLGRRWKAEKYVIVTYELAKIGLPNEQMMVADCDHYELCTHYNPEFRQRLIGFCQEKLLEAHGKMLGRPGSSSVASTDVLGEGSKVPSPW